jgi:hypothetical protein
MSVRITFRYPITEIAHRLHRTFWQQCCVNASLEYGGRCCVRSSKLICCKKKLIVAPGYWINAVCHTTTYNLPLDEVAGNGVYRPHVELSWPRLHHSWIHLRPEILPLFALAVRKYIKCNYCGACLSESGRSANLLRIRRHLWWKFHCTNAKEWDNGIQNLRVINAAIIC